MNETESLEFLVKTVALKEPFERKTTLSGQVELWMEYSLEGKPREDSFNGFIIRSGWDLDALRVERMKIERNENAERAVLHSFQDEAEGTPRKFSRLKRDDELTQDEQTTKNAMLAEIDGKTREKEKIIEAAKELLHLFQEGRMEVFLPERPPLVGPNLLSPLHRAAAEISGQDSREVESEPELRDKDGMTLSQGEKSPWGGTKSEFAKHVIAEYQKDCGSPIEQRRYRSLRNASDSIFVQFSFQYFKQWTKEQCYDLVRKH